MSLPHGIVQRADESRDNGQFPLQLNSGTVIWTFVVMIAVASLALRIEGATPDVSWLTSMCERMLDGERGWIDIFETTPPVPTLLYMPGVLFARLLGISSEVGVFAFAYAATLLTLLFVARLLPDDKGASRWTIVFPAALFLFFVSNDSFAQREYFAAAFALPMFVVFVRRAQDGRWPPVGDRVIAAILAGLSFAIKPPLFALPFVALAGFEWARTRRLSFLFPSMLPVAAVSGVAVTAVSLAAFPAYLEGVTTLMRDVYVPIRANPLMGFRSPPFSGFALCLAISIIFMARRRPPVAASLALVMAGAYAAIFFIQGKFFGYHLLPAALFAAIALAALFREWAMSLVGTARRTAPFAIYGSAVFAVAFLLFNGFSDGRPQMRDLAWADDLDRPTALAISPDISIGFPLAQHVGARWVDRIHGQWVANYTRLALARGQLASEERERYRRYHDRDIERTRREIRIKAPELIFQCAAENCAWLTEELLAEDPALLDVYEEVAKDGAIRVLRRRAGMTAKAGPSD